MQDRQRRQAALANAIAHDVEDLGLVAEVEVRRRLVEQEDGGVLRERARQEDALALAAGERVEASRLEALQAQARERGVRDGGGRRRRRSRGPSDAARVP